MQISHVSFPDMDRLHKTLAKSIRNFAEKREIALMHLPDLAGVTRSHFWEIMAGRKSPTLRWLQPVAKALKVEVWELLKPTKRKTKSKK